MSAAARSLGAILAQAQTERKPDSTPISCIVDTNRCVHCRRKETELRTKLKRCVGCSVTLYCSKECQKAAWALHKHVCSPKTEEGLIPESPGSGDPTQGRSLAGRPQTTATLSAAVYAWVAAHGHGHMAVTALIAQLEGTGIQLQTNHDPPFVVVFQLIPGDAARTDFTGGSTSPAETFTMRAYNALSRDEFEDKLGSSWPRSSWAMLQLQCEEMRESMRTQQYPAHWRVIPTVYLVPLEGSQIVIFTPLRVPIHPRSLLGLSAGSPVDLGTRAVLEDVTAMCMIVINWGLVMRWEDWVTGTQAGDSMPEVGKMVRRGKAWVWKKNRNWDWDLPSLARLMSPLQTGRTPRELWTRFDGRRA